MVMLLHPLFAEPDFTTSCSKSVDKKSLFYELLPKIKLLPQLSVVFYIINDSPHKLAVVSDYGPAAKQPPLRMKAFIKKQNASAITGPHHNKNSLPFLLEDRRELFSRTADKVYGQHAICVYYIRKKLLCSKQAPIATAALIVRTGTVRRAFQWWRS
jgi:hypothetical protein